MIRTPHKTAYSIFKALTIALLFYYLMLSLLYNMMMVCMPAQSLIEDIDMLQQLYANLFELFNILVIFAVVWILIFIIRCIKEANTNKGAKTYMKKKQEIAEDIATQCDRLVEKAGFDPETQGVGFDLSGTFYTVTGDDLDEGLDGFFDWIKSELPEEIETIQKLQQAYDAYCQQQ